MVLGRPLGMDRTSSGEPVIREQCVMHNGYFTFFTAVQICPLYITERPVEQSFINIGFGNIVAKHRIIAVVAPDSSPIKKLRNTAREARKLIDASHGRRTRAVIITDSDHVVLSANGMETILQRLQDRDGATET